MRTYCYYYLFVTIGNNMFGVENNYNYTLRKKYNMYKFNKIFSV